MKTPAEKAAYQRQWRAANLNRAKEIAKRSVDKNRGAIYARNKAYRLAHPDLVKQRRAVYAANNREKILESRRASYRRHKAKHLKTCKAWVARNKVKVRGFHRAWKKRNPEKVRAAHVRRYPKMAITAARWKKRNPAKVLDQANRRRALKLSATTEDCTRKISLLQHSRFCHWCCAPLSPSEVTIDHVTPLFRGGKHSPENIVASCKSCNSSKSTKLVSEWTWTPYDSRPIELKEAA